MINVDGLSFRFQGSSTHALRDVNLNIAPGEFVVVTGPSGCGKSTLAMAIGGYLFRQFDGQAEGVVTVDGIDARRSPIYDVAEIVGLVQQNPEAQFCTLTVRDEMAFGLENRCLPRAEMQERIDWALSIVGAEHLAERHLATLSGGEKQKVAVAAIMAAKPRVLIFDEPTSNLDPTATAEIFEVIDRIRAKAGITVIVIEHKLDYLRAFEPRLVRLEEGRIAYDGPMKNGPRLPTLPKGRGSKRAGHNELLARVYNLHAGYNGGCVLRGLSLEVRAGEFVAIMGDNGSGKTTFLHCLLGLLKPDQGQVETLGCATRHTPVSQLARQVGFCFQNPDHQLFAESVWEEATFAPRNLGTLDQATTERVGELLDRCGLGQRHDDHPYRLSYGQKRRLNLISALAHGPRLILLDELLIGQDPANAAFLMELLREQVERGAAVVMINHAPQVTRCYASRLLFFNDGQIVVDALTEQAFGQLRAIGWEAYVA